MYIDTEINHFRRHTGYHNPFINYVHKALQQTKPKNKKWISKFILMKDVEIYLDNYTLTSRTPVKKRKYVERICETIDAFNAKYGEDWDIIISPVNDRAYQIGFIHIFKEVTVINSQHLTHKIEDLVVVMEWRCINSEGLIKSMQFKMTGSRMCLSPKEISSAYQHSHLSRWGVPDDVSNLSFNLFETHNFCIGGESETANVLDDLMVDYHPEKIQLFLYLVDSYVAWESLEGGPYVKMQDLTNLKKKVYSVTGNINAKTLRYILEYAQDYGRPLDLDYYIKDGRFKINCTHKTIEFLKEALKMLATDTFYKTQLVKQHLITRDYYSYSEELYTGGVYQIHPDLASKYFYYNGTPVKFRLDFSEYRTDRTEPLNPLEYTLHPNLLQYVITELEQRLYKRAIKISRIAKQNLLSTT